MVDAILEAASRVLGNHEYEDATTIRVAERAGISVGSLYQYFPNKDGILSALAARIVNHHLNRLEQKIATLGNLPAHEAIEELVKLITSLYFTNKRPMRILFERAARKDLAPIIFGARKRAIGMIEALLARYPRECLKPRDPRLAATLLVHGILGVLEMVVVEQFEGTSDEVLTHEISALARRYLFSD
jgi:AcrR family transcriptional regulator